MKGQAPANLPVADHLHEDDSHAHDAHGHAITREDHHAPHAAVNDTHAHASHDSHGHHDAHHGHDHGHHDAHGHGVKVQRPYMERLFEILAEPIWKFSGDFDRRNSHDHHAHH